MPGQSLTLYLVSTVSYIVRCQEIQLVSHSQVHFHLELPELLGLCEQRLCEGERGHHARVPRRRPRVRRRRRRRGRGRTASGLRSCAGKLCAYLSSSSGNKNKFCLFLVVVQLIHRLTQADISCTTTARMFVFQGWGVS